MDTNHSLLNNTLVRPFPSEEKISTTEIINPGFTAISTQLIRFEEKRERYIWAHPDEIIFVISADHYVKSLIKCGKQMKWMSRHSTIKELLAILSADNFIRLNKFYLLN